MGTAVPQNFQTIRGDDTADLTRALSNHQQLPPKRGGQFDFIDREVMGASNIDVTAHNQTNMGVT